MAGKHNPEESSTTKTKMESEEEESKTVKPYDKRINVFAVTSLSRSYLSFGISSFNGPSAIKIGNEQHKLM